MQGLRSVYIGQQILVNESLKMYYKNHVNF